MPGYANADRAVSLPAAALAGLLLLLAACGEPAESGQFEIVRVEAHWTNGELRGRCEQKLTLGAEAREALRHGVALTVELELILRNTGDQTRVGQDTTRYEIRYLPLSEHYQVSGLQAGHVATFPRLRHALAELSIIDFRLDTGALPAGDYELLARSRLDRSSLPPPMRLPALFDPGWKHASGWSSWPLTVDAGA